MDFKSFCQLYGFIGFSFYGIKTEVRSGKKLRKIPIHLPQDWVSIEKSTINKEHKAFAVRTGRISGITVLDFDNMESYAVVIGKLI